MSLRLIQRQVRLNTAMDLTKGSLFFLSDFTAETALATEALYFLDQSSAYITDTVAARQMEKRAYPGCYFDLMSQKPHCSAYCSRGKDMHIQRRNGKLPGSNRKGNTFSLVAVKTYVIRLARNKVYCLFFHHFEMTINSGSIGHHSFVAAPM
uniref:Uncharacterized protein n=1 Tax=Arundo donax TaxID=35708 RepID=A0A0A9HTE7_ARUDO